ncbi:MAG: preprotein translocase subunit YajC [Deltaproteobacteria bacterium]|nr:preprotein translocase subunit YajC [Deltaproteobacteria bacterium]
MTGIAYAMGAGGAGGGGAPGGDMSFIVVMVAIFAIFYFLLIRPQQKKQKETKAMLSNLAHGDIVVTVGGLHGKITAVAEQVVTLEIADKVKIKVSRGHIATIIQKETS